MARYQTIPRVIEAVRFWPDTHPLHDASETPVMEIPYEEDEETIHLEKTSTFMLMEIGDVGVIREGRNANYYFVKETNDCWIDQIEQQWIVKNQDGTITTYDDEEFTAIFQLAPPDLKEVV